MKQMEMSSETIYIRNASHRPLISIKCIRALPRSPHRVVLVHALDVDFFIVIGVNVLWIVRFVPRRRRRGSGYWQPVPQTLRFGTAIYC